MSNNEMGFDTVTTHTDASSEQLSHSAGTLQFEVGTSLDEIEREVIMATLQHCHGCKRETAKTLGISVKTLYNRLHEYHRANPMGALTPAFSRAPALADAA